MRIWMVFNTSTRRQCVIDIRAPNLQWTTDNAALSILKYIMGSGGVVATAHYVFECGMRQAGPSVGTGHMMQRQYICEWREHQQEHVNHNQSIFVGVVANGIAVCFACAPNWLRAADELFDREPYNLMFWTTVSSNYRCALILSSIIQFSGTGDNAINPFLKATMRRTEAIDPIIALFTNNNHSNIPSRYQYVPLSPWAHPHLLRPSIGTG